MTESHQYLSESRFRSLVGAGSSCKQSGHTGLASGLAFAHGLRQSGQTSPPIGLVEKYKEIGLVPQSRGVKQGHVSAWDIKEGL